MAIVIKNANLFILGELLIIKTIWNALKIINMIALADKIVQPIWFDKAEIGTEIFFKTRKSFRFILLLDILIIKCKMYEHQFQSHFHQKINDCRQQPVDYGCCVLPGKKGPVLQKNYCFQIVTDNALPSLKS